MLPNFFDADITTHLAAPLGRYRQHLLCSHQCVVSSRFAPKPWSPIAQRSASFHQSMRLRQELPPYLRIRALQSSTRCSQLPHLSPGYMCFVAVLLPLEEAADRREGSVTEGRHRETAFLAAAFRTRAKPTVAEAAGHAVIRSI